MSHFTNTYFYSCYTKTTYDDFNSPKTWHIYAPIEIEPNTVDDTDEQSKADMTTNCYRTKRNLNAGTLQFQSQVTM